MDTINPICTLLVTLKSTYNQPVKSAKKAMLDGPKTDRFADGKVLNDEWGMCVASIGGLTLQ